MTDTTAPRTAAEDHRCGWCHQPFTGSFNAHRGNECPDMRDEIRPAFRRAIEAEAIEPLLALVRALEAAKIPHLVVDGDCWYSCGLAVDPYDGEPACCNEDERGRCTCGADRHNAAIDEAIAALPESVRVAARKPE